MELVATFTNNNDWYLIGADFDSYIKCQTEVSLYLLLRWTNVIGIRRNGPKCQY